MAFIQAGPRLLRVARHRVGHRQLEEHPHRAAPGETEVPGLLPARRSRAVPSPLVVPHQRVDCNLAPEPPLLLAANRVVGKARVLAERSLLVALHRRVDLVQLAEQGPREALFQQVDHAPRVGPLQLAVRRLPVDPSQRVGLAPWVEPQQPVELSQRVALPRRAEPLQRAALPPRVDLLQPVDRLRRADLPQPVEPAVVQVAAVAWRIATQWATRARMDGI